MTDNYYDYPQVGTDGNGNPVWRFGEKDNLPAGDPDKVIYGRHLDSEFKQIANSFIEVGKDIREVVSVEKGDKPGDTLYWDNNEQSWVHTGALQVQPGFGWSSQGDEVEINAELCVNSMKVQQGTGNALGMVDGRQGFQIRSYRYDNANDGWTGTTGNTWEILGLEARDNGAEPDRQNGIDLTADRVTIRNTRDYADPNWLDTQIMFRVDGKEVEIGTRNNSIDKFVVNCDTDLTGQSISNLGDPKDDTGAVSKGYVARTIIGDLPQEVEDNNLMIGDLFEEAIRVAIVLENHGNRLDRLEGKMVDALAESNSFEEFKARMIKSIADLGDRTPVAPAFSWKKKDI